MSVSNTEQRTAIVDNISLKICKYQAFLYTFGTYFFLCIMSKKLTNSEFINRINAISNGGISILSCYEGSNERALCKCNICGNEWYTTPSKLLYKKQGCKKCKMKLVWEKRKDKTTKESLTKRISNIFPQYDLSKIHDTVKSQKEPIIVICPKHGEFKTTADSILHGHECARCSYEKRAMSRAIKHNETVARSKEIHGDKYDYSNIPQNIRCDMKIPIKCYIHGIFMQTPYHHIQRKQGCPCCGESHLEREFADFLTEKNVEFIRQERFNWLGLQSLDFYLPKYKIAIECQGDQHYAPFSLFGGKESYAKQVERDARKLKLCIENGVKLIYFTHYRFESNLPKDTFNSTDELFKYINTFNHGTIIEEHT